MGRNGNGSGNGTGNGDGHKVSRINQSTCTRCGRSYWRWESKRTECLLCKPLSPRETQRALKAAGCDQPAVQAAPQYARGSHPNHEKSPEVQPVKNYASKILQLLFASRPS